MGDVDAVDHRGGGKERPRRWRWLAALARRQHGVVARRQLLKLGFSSREIEGLLARSHLQRLHRGVYAVGHTQLTPKGRRMAAVLACGTDAVLSHRSAVALWGLRPPPSGPADVIVPGRSRHSREGIRVHNVRKLDGEDRATVDGIPVTSLHRTLLDYAEVAGSQQLRHALDAAERRELLDSAQLEALCDRNRGHRGLKALRAAAAKLRGSAPWTQSELERRFLALIREAGLPEPATNVLVEGELVDCFWPDARLVVEVDGYEFHKPRAQFDSDRKRDAKLMLAGHRVLRTTHPRIDFEAAELVHDLRRLLTEPPSALAADR